MRIIIIQIQEFPSDDLWGDEILSCLGPVEFWSALKSQTLVARCGKVFCKVFLLWKAFQVLSTLSKKHSTDNPGCWLVVRSLDHSPRLVQIISTLTFEESVLQYNRWCSVVHVAAKCFSPANWTRSETLAATMQFRTGLQIRANACQVLCTKSGWWQTNPDILSFILYKQ